MGNASNDNYALPADDGLTEWPRVQTLEPIPVQPSFQPQAFTESSAFQYLNLDQPDFVSLGDTEDLLQYIFPEPNNGTIAGFPEQDEPVEGVEASTNQAASHDRNNFDQTDETSPPALLQLNAMIHDNVSLPT